jgi:hypothetical protein
MKKLCRARETIECRDNVQMEDIFSNLIWEVTVTKILKEFIQLNSKKANNQFKDVQKSQSQWLMSIILVTWEVEGASQFQVSPRKKSWAWWRIPVIPAWMGRLKWEDCGQVCLGKMWDSISKIIRAKKGLRCDSRKSLASTGLEFKPQYCAPPIKIEKEHE